MSCDMVTFRRDVICDVDGWVGQVKVMSRLESAERRAALFPQDGTASTHTPLTDVEVVIVKDRWVGEEVYLQWEGTGSVGRWE